MQIILEGHDRPVSVEAGDTILASLLRAGIAFPFSCQAGNCGTCKCELVSGDVLELEYSEHALSAQERAKGIILACRTQVWDDTVVRRIDTEELQVFDEPAIRLAPTPYAKWLTCRVAMEEYHHHVRFKELADQIGVKPEEMDTRNKRPLNIFELPLENWEQFCVIKMLGDLAEILQVEDLLHCSFVPLRNIARTTMPEEKFHAQFGLDFCVDLVETPGGRDKVQRAVNRFYPEAPKFFGASRSKNNEMFRKYGLKLRSNEDMRADYMARAKSTVDPLGITLPDVRIAA